MFCSTVQVTSHWFSVCLRFVYYSFQISLDFFLFFVGSSHCNVTSLTKQMEFLIISELRNL